MNLATVIAGLRTICHAHIDALAWCAMKQHGVAVEFARRSIGQRFRHLANRREKWQ
jgi:hypothetical protein